MLAKDLISDVIPALRTSDTGTKALGWMDIFKVAHLPIVNSEDFLGVISESDIYDVNMPDEPLGNHPLSLQRPYVLEDQHVFEIMDVMARLQLSLIPVLNRNKQYVGVISLPDLLHYFAELSALKNPGGIVVLELIENDYSLAHIAQIVEGNGVKILSSYITAHKDSTKIELTLKLNVVDLTSIIQTFNRYEYTIVGSHMRVDEMDDLMEERFDLLMRYLNV